MQFSIEAITLAVSAVAFIVSIYSARQVRSDTHYQDLDGLYLEVLKIGIAHPRFVNPRHTQNYKTAFQDDEFYTYQTYANLVWNICETIIDRRTDKKLLETWEPVVLAEYCLHGTWLCDADNHHKFKPEFLKYVRESLMPKAGTAAQ